MAVMTADTGTGAGQPLAPRHDELALLLTAACVKAPPSWSVADDVDDCLLQLARAAEDRVRLTMANRLADCSWAPAGVVRFLAADRLDIATPVLSRCLALSEADLISIAQSDRERRLLLAGRLRVSEPVVRALASWREPDVLDRLARNDGARLGDASADDFAAIAKDDRELQIALAAREDLSAGFAQALFAVAAQTVAESLQRRFPQLSRHHVETVTAASVEADESNDPETAAARLVGRLDISGRLDAAFVLRSLADAPGPVFDHGLARLCAIPVRTWRRALAASPVRACALACRCISADNRSVAPMVRALTRQGRIHAVDEMNLTRAGAEIYDHYDPAHAGRGLRMLGGEASIAS